MATDNESIKLLIEAVNQSQAVLTKAIADLDKFDSGAKKATESTKGLVTHSTAAHGAIRNLGVIAASVAGPLIALFTVERIIAFTRETLEAAEALNRFKEETAFTTDQLNRWSLAATKANLSQGQLQMSVNVFARQLAQLNDPMSAVSLLMNRLGIETRNAAGHIKPTGELLELFGKEMLKYEASGDRAAAMQDMFGRSGARMISVFNDLKDSVNEATSITKEHMEAAEKLSRIESEFGRILQVVVLDALTPFIGKLGDLIAADGKLTSSGAAVKETFRDIAAAVKVTFGAMSDLYGIASKLTDKLIWMSPLGFAAKKFAEKAGSRSVESDNAIAAVAAAAAFQERSQPAAGFVARAQAQWGITGAGAGAGGPKPFPADFMREVETTMKRFDDDRLVAEANYKKALGDTQEMQARGQISLAEGAQNEILSTKELESALQSLAQQMANLQKAHPSEFKMLGMDAKFAAIETEAQTARLKSYEIVLKEVDRTLRDYNDQRIAAQERYSATLTRLQAQEERGQITKSQEEAGNILAAKELDDALKGIINTLEDLDKKFPVEGKALGLRARIGALRGEQGEAGIKAGAPSPGDLHQGLVDFNKSLVGMDDKTKLVAATLNATLRPAIDGIGDSIYGVITGTSTWGKTFLQVGAQIVQSLIKIGVQMLAQHLIRMIIHKEENAATNKTIIKDSYAAAIKAYKAMADIPYVGPILGAAAFAATLALGLAAAAFKEGGYTGNGPTDAPAGIVHGGEVVIPAPTVSALGPQYFARYFEGGRMPGYQSGGFVSAPAMSAASSGPSRYGPMQVNVAIANTRQDQREFALQHGYKILVDQFTKRSNVVYA